MKWVAIVIGVVVGALFVWVALGKGVKVTVENVSDAAITNVRIEVTGAKYALDDLGPGKSDAVKVEPTMPTDRVRIRWTDAKGKERFARVDADIDPGNTHGTVTVQVGQDVLSTQAVDLSHGFF